MPVQLSTMVGGGGPHSEGGAGKQEATMLPQPLELSYTTVGCKDRGGEEVEMELQSTPLGIFICVCACIRACVRACGCVCICAGSSPCMADCLVGGMNNAPYPHSQLHGWVNH